MLWFLIGLSVLNVILTIAMIGKPRRPFTPADAVVSFIINFAIIAALLIWYPR